MCIPWPGFDEMVEIYLTSNTDPTVEPTPDRVGFLSKSKLGGVTAVWTIKYFAEPAPSRIILLLRSAPTFRREERWLGFAVFVHSKRVIT